MLPQWLNLNHFLSNFLWQASWFCPVWSKLEAITSGSGELTSHCYTLWLIFHNTANSFKVLTETLNMKASVIDENFLYEEKKLRRSYKRMEDGEIKAIILPCFKRESKNKCNKIIYTIII